ncbi:hypothetical protein B0H16DRAFT_1686652, partial [Mycena metata]
MDMHKVPRRQKLTPGTQMVLKTCVSHDQPDLEAQTGWHLGGVRNLRLPPQLNGDIGFARGQGGFKSRLEWENRPGIEEKVEWIVEVKSQVEVMCSGVFVPRSCAFIV